MEKEGNPLIIKLPSDLTNVPCCLEILQGIFFVDS